MKPAGEVLRRGEYEVREVALAVCQEKVRLYHYAGGGSNTAVFRHGLYCVKSMEECIGIAWWIPPTKAAAQANYPENWRGVLVLSRLVIDPGVPKNAASYLIMQSVRLIRQDRRWEYLLTYADERQGHSGAIYRATNWDYLGKTNPEATWIDVHGRMISRKAGPHTRTKAEMEKLGYKMIGKFAKHRFGMKIR
jgi:hypothetical protein